MSRLLATVRETESSNLEARTNGVAVDFWEEIPINPIAEYGFVVFIIFEGQIADTVQVDDSNASFSSLCLLLLGFTFVIRRSFPPLRSARLQKDGSL